MYCYSQGGLYMTKAQGALSVVSSKPPAHWTQNLQAQRPIGAVPSKERVKATASLFWDGKRQGLGSRQSWIYQATARPAHANVNGAILRQANYSKSWRWEAQGKKYQLRILVCVWYWILVFDIGRAGAHILILPNHTVRTTTKPGQYHESLHCGQGNGKSTTICSNVMDLNASCPCLWV